jgi:DNA repair exonuclease SbcCD ATPase subunit
MKAVQSGNPIALNAFKKKLERAYTSSLTAYLEALKLKETNSQKRSTLQEIKKLRAEINQVEAKRTTKKNQPNQELVL